MSDPRIVINIQNNYGPIHSIPESFDDADANDRDNTDLINKQFELIEALEDEYGTQETCGQPNDHTDCQCDFVKARSTTKGTFGYKLTAEHTEELIHSVNNFEGDFCMVGIEEIGGWACINGSMDPEDNKVNNGLPVAACVTLKGGAIGTDGAKFDVTLELTEDQIYDLILELEMLVSDYQKNKGKTS